MEIGYLKRGNQIKFDLLTLMLWEVRHLRSAELGRHCRRFSMMCSICSSSVGDVVDEVV